MQGKSVSTAGCDQQYQMLIRTTWVEDWTISAWEHGLHWHHQGEV